MRHRLHADDAAPERTAEDTVEVRRLFDAQSGCATFSQRLLRFGRGRSETRVDAAADEVLYVLDGTATVTVDDTDREVRPGSALFVAAGASWTVQAQAPVELLSVLVHDPEPASARHGLVEIGAEGTQRATAGREFRLGATPDCGCETVTQFVGHIPPGRAPDHFHTYDEVVYVLDGSGTLHIGGDTAPLSPGAAVHLPARLVHALENEGETDMLVLGVFRPAGSPAEAYYPDGTPASVPES